jgi:hypothetical protein
VVADAGAADRYPVRFCSSVKFDFLLTLENSNNEAQRSRRVGGPRLSNRPRAANFFCERLRGADELDGGAGPQEHDGPAWHQGRSSRAERE